MRKLTVGLEWFLNPDHLPLMIGQKMGWFEEAGIELVLVEPEEHLDAVEAIEKGEMDLAITEPLHLVEDRAEDKPVVGFARFLHTNGGVMYLKGGAIQRPRDMAGVRIQYPGSPGPGGPAIVQTMIEADGGQCDPEEFGRVNKGFYHTDALIDGEADVATLVFYNFEMVEARHRGVEAGFFALKDWGVPDFCQLIFITHPRTLAEEPDVLRTFLRVVGRGLDFIHQHREEARKIYFEWTETEKDDALTGEIFDATVPCFTFDFSMSREYYDGLSAWLAERGLIQRRDDPVEYWTNQLL